MKLQRSAMSLTKNGATKTNLIDMNAWHVFLTPPVLCVVMSLRAPPPHACDAPLLTNAAEIVNRDSANTC